MLFVYYPKCTTCKKAQKWLQEHGKEFEVRDIKEENPTYEELKEILYKQPVNTLSPLHCCYLQPFYKRAGAGTSQSKDKDTIYVTNLYR